MAAPKAPDETRVLILGASFETWQAGRLQAHMQTIGGGVPMAYTGTLLGFRTFLNHHQETLHKEFPR